MEAKKQNEVVSAPQNAAVTPIDMLNRALEKGVDTEQLSKLMELQQRWEADEARKAYVRAMAAFKAEPLTLLKDREVSFSGTSYSHASLPAVVDAVVSALSKYGLSHRWDTSQSNGDITVTCVITHEQGHSERTTLTAGPDKSGSKNNIQALGSTVTYLERYTLMAAMGLAARGMDDDAKGADALETVSDEQVKQIEKLIKEVGANKAQFLAWAKCDSIDQILAKNFQNVVDTLERKRKAKA